ncbi:MAG: VOC family protein [Pyrinomonadaceae bacterium]
MGNVATFLTFAGGGAEAVEFYCSLFKNSKVHAIHKHPGGALLHASFEIDGHRFMAMDGGDPFKFAEGFSIFANVETQDEIDGLWNALTADGGEPGQCGWLKDRWGVSWQIIPSVLGQLMSGPDRERAGRVMQAMLKMNKLIVADLENA